MFKRMFLLASAVSFAVGVYAGSNAGDVCTRSGIATINGLIENLESVGCYRSQLNYQVLMSLQDDVEYNVDLQSLTVAGDEARCEYLVQWSVPGRESSDGFAAYFPGNFYTFRGDRMLEYHLPADSVALAGRDSGGVHTRMQFAAFIPQLMGRELRGLIESGNYHVTFNPDTLYNGTAAISLHAVMRVNDVLTRDVLYVFDKSNGMPVYVESENNPGALAEQTIVVRYDGTSVDKSSCPRLSEQYLRDRFPDIFDRFRESVYTVTNLPGQKLPTFTLPTPTGERYTYHRGGPFRSPTLIVLLDAAGGFVSETIEGVRRATLQLPVNTDIIWAFTGTNTDEIDNVIVRPEIGEHILFNAKSLARDTGASALPVIIVANSDGSVSSVIVGYNKDLSSSVIEKASQAR